ncbi:MAG TPA: hypothetical protein DDZ39_06975 [Flavobacteriaceae bacterium]|jgi:hypothetical protein|nr:hypothetical protein [Flavobacteriaceae bacterium]HBS10971.1 hypothetical protein [Flavobacteriaceae bacterium]
MTGVEEIKELIRKNRKRLNQELIESKELMLLLTKSTHTKLTEGEKEKIKEQLLDILKGIPAFTIFMLPGGVLLLPLFIKLIPGILPSSFKNDEEE